MEPQRKTHKHCFILFILYYNCKIKSYINNKLNNYIKKKKSYILRTEGAVEYFGFSHEGKGYVSANILT